MSSEIDGLATASKCLSPYHATDDKVSVPLSALSGALGFETASKCSIRKTSEERTGRPATSANLSHGFFGGPGDGIDEQASELGSLEIGDVAEGGVEDASPGGRVVDPGDGFGSVDAAGAADQERGGP